MDAETTRMLQQLNATFYRAHAASFVWARQQPWPGWRRVVAGLRQRSRVLDVGCGHGRFGAYLLHARPDAIYVGVEPCVEMLALAPASLVAAPNATLVEGTLEEALPSPRQPFDLVTAFGVLHHIPGSASRAAFVRTLAAAVGPGGRLVLTVWQLDRSRFAKRVVPWATYNRGAATPIDTAQLEDGDLLLRWRSEGVRYCHRMAEVEMTGLATTAGLRLARRFSADGKTGDLNVYLVLSRDETAR